MAIIKPVSSILWTRLYIFLVCFSVAGHTFSTLLRLNPGIIAPFASFLTLLLGLFASQQEYLAQGKKPAWLRSATVLVLGATAELLSLTTGFPFGHYRYTDRWWPSVSLDGYGSFPILLPFAWLLVGGSAAFAAQVTKDRTVNGLIAAGIATLLDLLMEGTLAGKMDYWHWESIGRLPGHSPYSNSIAWFVITFFAAQILYITKLKGTGKRESVIVLIGQAMLMLTLRFS